MVDDVGTPVEQLTAAELGDGLPVVTALVAVAGELDFVDIAELAGVDDVHSGFKAAFEATVVADEKLGAAGLTAEGDELTGLGGGHTEGLFKKDILTGQKRHFGMGIVVDGAGGDADELDLGIGQQVFDPGVGTAAPLFDEGLCALFDDVADSGEVEFIAAGGEFLAVHAVAGAAKADETDLNGLGHGIRLLFVFM